MKSILSMKTAVIVFLFCGLPSSALAGKSLTDAYQKEFAFLEAEKKALESRLKNIFAERRRRMAKGNGEISTLQASLLEEQEKIAQLEDSLQKREGEADRMGEDHLRIMETLQRASDRLKKEKGLELTLPGEEAKPKEVAAAIEALFSQANTLLAETSTIRTEDGTFFTEEGQSVSGTIVRFGHVGLYGVSETTAGALAPAGGDSWKIWPENAAETARKLNTGALLANGVDIFLFDSPEKAVEPKVEKTALMIVESGGVIAWVIVWLGVAALLLALARFLLIMWRTIGANDLRKKVSESLKGGNRDLARQLVDDKRLSLSNVLRATIAPGDDREDQENRISEAILAESPRLTRFGSAMTVIAAVAPLMGLLGTVTGMISTFDVITEHGTGDPRMLSGGISEALVTTELGLIVAIPTLILGALLSARAQQSIADLEQGALNAINSMAQRPTMEETPAPIQEAS